MHPVKKDKLLEELGENGVFFDHPGSPVMLAVLRTECPNPWDEPQFRHQYSMVVIGSVKHPKIDHLDHIPAVKHWYNKGKGGNLCYILSSYQHLSDLDQITKRNNLYPPEWWFKLRGKR